MSERFNESLEFPSRTFPELIQHLPIDVAKPFDPTCVNLSCLRGKVSSLKMLFAQRYMYKGTHCKVVCNSQKMTYTLSYSISILWNYMDFLKNEVALVIEKSSRLLSWEKKQVAE